MADDEVVRINGKLLKDLRVKDLKEQLENRRLSKIGTKAQLIARLKSQMLLEKLQNQPHDERLPTLETDGDTDNEYVKQYLEQRERLFAAQQEARHKLEEEEALAKASGQGDIVLQSEESQEEDSQTEPESPVKGLPAAVVKQPNRGKRGRKAGAPPSRRSVRQSASETDQSIDDPEADISTDDGESLSPVKNTSTNEPVVAVRRTERPEENLASVPEDQTATLHRTGGSLQDQQVEATPSEQSTDDGEAEEVTKLSGNTEQQEEVRSAKFTIQQDESEKQAAEPVKTNEEPMEQPEDLSFKPEKTAQKYTDKPLGNALSEEPQSAKQSQSAEDIAEKSVQSTRPKHDEQTTEEMLQEQSNAEEDLPEKVAESKCIEDGIDAEITLDYDEDLTREAAEAERPTTVEVKEEEVRKEPTIQARKISISKNRRSRSSKDQEEDKDDESEKPKRRRWGTSSKSSTSKKTSLNISTQFLKELIPDLKTSIAAEPDIKEEVVDEEEMMVQDGRVNDEVVVVEPQADSSDVKEDMHHAEVVISSGEDQFNSDNEVTQVAASSETKARKRVVSQTSVTLPVDEPVHIKGRLSPARNPVNCTIHIQNLTRPFTVGQLKELLSKHGPLVVDEKSFWIDKIKTHCYATFEEREAAEAARKDLHGSKWPSSNPKLLSVEFASLDEVAFRKDREQAKIEGIPLESQERAAAKRKEREERIAEALKKRQEEREKRLAARKKKSPSPPMREWDKHKLRQSASPPITRTIRRSSEREKTGRERSRDKAEQRESRRESRDVPEEKKVKLLDDLFKKTAATPQLYYLPLTEEQAKERVEAAEKMAAIKAKKQEEMERERIERQKAEARRREQYFEQRRKEREEMEERRRTRRMRSRSRGQRSRSGPRRGSPRRMRSRSRGRRSRSGRRNGPPPEARRRRQSHSSSSSSSSSSDSSRSQSRQRPSPPKRPRAVSGSSSPPRNRGSPPEKKAKSRSRSPAEPASTTTAHPGHSPRKNGKESSSSSGSNSGSGSDSGSGSGSERE